MNKNWTCADISKALDELELAARDAWAAAAPEIRAAAIGDVEQAERDFGPWLGEVESQMRRSEMTDGRPRQ